MSLQVLKHGCTDDLSSFSNSGAHGYSTEACAWLLERCEGRFTSFSLLQDLDDLLFLTSIVRDLF